MHQLDLIILTSAGVGFIFFVTAHVATFRILNRKGILKNLIRIFLAGGLAGLAIVPVFSRPWTAAPGMDLVKVLITVCFFNLLIYGLMCFLYVLYIFGPYESSIRFRLVYELYRNNPDGMEIRAIERNYNPDIILKRRLERLLASGDLIEVDGVYRLARVRNIFIALDRSSASIRKFITHL